MYELVETGLVRSVRAAIIRCGVQRAFMSRLVRAKRNVRLVMIASPWISTFEGRPYSLARFTAHLRRFTIPGYVFTRPPETAEQAEAVNILTECPLVELVYNSNLHAKIYACLGPQPYGFAILGSANMTTHSASLYEIGLLVLSASGGDFIVKELAEFGLNYLRTRPDSRVIKKRGRSRHGL